MSSPLVRVRGWNAGGKPMDFIYIVRAHTGIDLRTAKEMLLRLQADTAVVLTPLDSDNPRRVGEELLRIGAIREAELVVENQPAQAIGPPPTPPIFICPGCRGVLKHRSECDMCGWLSIASDRGRWDNAGPCPHCGFSYRYDGSSCSHCGHGGTELPAPL